MFQQGQVTYQVVDERQERGGRANQGSIPAAKLTNVLDKNRPYLDWRETEGQLSPDGRWVAYQSNESGRNEVYVAPFPTLGGKWQISAGGGTLPRWRRDGTEIFYLAPDKKLFVAAVNGKGGSFEVGVVKPLFQTHAVGSRQEYGVSADGQRFLINTAPAQTALAPITVVLNWTAGLKK